MVLATADDGIKSSRGGTALVRPAGQVHDPDGWLPVIELRAIEAGLLEMRERDGVDLRLAILTKAPDLAGPPFAERLVAEWGESDANGVVVHVVGSDGPWMAVGGTLPALAGRNAVDDVLREASRRVAGEPDERRRVVKAVEELSDFLRFLGNRGLYHEERRKTARLEAELHYTRKQLYLRLGVVGGVLGAGILGLFVYGSWRHWRRHRAPLRFPETVWRARFGAPYCGGGDAVVRFADTRQRK